MTRSLRVRIFVLLLMLLVSRIVSASHHVSTTRLASPLSAFPLQIADWSGVNGPDLDPETLRVLGADEYLNRVYVNPDGQALGLYVAYYAQQQQGDSIHSPQNCLPGNGWQAISHTRPALDVDGRLLPVNRYVVERRRERQLVVYWYEGRGRAIANEYLNKLYLLHDAVRLGRTDGALVRISTPLAPGLGRADEATATFVRAVMPYLTRWIPR